MFASLAFDPSDNPAISYHDQTNGLLKFAHRMGGVWTTETVDNQGPPGLLLNTVMGTSLAYDASGMPAISYYSHWVNPHLRLARWTGVRWRCETVDPADAVGTHSSLAFDSEGNAGIAYLDGHNGDLKFAWFDGESWTLCVVDGEGSVGMYASLAFDNAGNPAISYLDDANWALKLAHGASNGLTGSWVWVTETVPDYGSVHGFTSLAFRPQDAIPYAYISYTAESGGFALGMEPPETNPEAYSLGSESFTHYLRFAYQRADGWHVESVDGSGDFMWTSLAFDADGDPAIAYYDCDDADLRFAYGVYDPFLGVYDWERETVDAEGEVGAWASLAFNDAGKPAVAYYQQVDDTTGNLKFAERVGWYIETVDSGPVSCGGTSLAVVNGNPAISYPYVVLGLVYVRANDKNGDTWGTPVRVDTARHVGQYSSLAVVAGNPAISYYCENNGDLKYVRANDTCGYTWGPPVVVDSDMDVGRYTSLVVVNGKPAISYYDSSYNDLKYVRANDATGASWGTPVVVDAVGCVGETASMAIVSGRPAISYFVNIDGDLRYVRASDANGDGWGRPVTVDSEGCAGLYASMAVVNGNPAISYHELDEGLVKYVRSLDAVGFSWGTPVVLGATYNPMSTRMLAVINGRPAVAYFLCASADLMYAQAGDANGDGWGQPVTVESHGDVGAWCSLALVNWKPAISYTDLDGNDLKYARKY